MARLIMNEEIIDEKTLYDNYYEEPYFEMITKISDLNDDASFTVARGIDGLHCVELHYVEGKATVEIQDRINDNYWEGIVETADWFNLDITEREIEEKLWQIFNYNFENEVDVNFKKKIV